jgi:hypothetical protein
MNLQPVEQCRCEGTEQVRANGTFWCECHQVWKGPHWHKLCQEQDGFRQLWNEGRGPGQQVVEPSKPGSPGLGDRLTTALKKVGITEENYKAVKAMFGLPPTCNCAGRREWLNRVGRWLAGETDNGN